MGILLRTAALGKARIFELAVTNHLFKSTRTVNRLRFAPDAIPDESTIERVILYVADD